MPAKTMEEKKREILEYLEEKSDSQQIIPLERQTITSELSDATFSNEAINNILDELLEEGLINSKEFKLEVVYPDQKGDDFLADLNPIDNASAWANFALGTYFFLVVVYSTGVINTFLSNSDNGQIASAALVAIIFSYVFGRIIGRASDIVTDKIPVLKEHKTFIYPTAFLLLTGILVVWVATNVYEKPVSIATIVSMPGTSILGGAAFARYIEEKGEE